MSLSCFCVISIKAHVKEKENETKALATLECPLPCKWSLLKRKKKGLGCFKERRCAVLHLATNHDPVYDAVGLLTCRESAAQPVFLKLSEGRVGSAGRAHRYWWNLEVGAWRAAGPWSSPSASRGSPGVLTWL